MGRLFNQDSSKYSQDLWFQRYHRFEAFKNGAINKVTNLKIHQGNPVSPKSKYILNFTVKEQLESNKRYFYKWLFLYRFYRRQKLVPAIKPSPQKRKRWNYLKLCKICSKSMDLVHNENVFVVDVFLTLVWCFKHGSLEPLKPFLEAMFINTLFERVQSQNRSSVFKSKVKITQINLLRMLSNHSSLFTSYWLSTLSWFP